MICDRSIVTGPGPVTPVVSQLVLSVFPGADLLGRGFEQEGYCVVRGPDIVWGGDIRHFHAPPGKFTGVIGGSPCQKFSLLNRNRPADGGEGVELLGQFGRVVLEACPDWFLLENVPTVPSIEVPGYIVQRFNLRASECGGRQRRNRCFQFGSRDGAPLVVDRSVTEEVTEGAAIASEANREVRRGFADFCELQGLPRDFDLPGLSVEAKYKAVGNGVPVYMARVIAQGVRCRGQSRFERLCVCNCGRPVFGRSVSATPACRKRLSRARAAI